MELIVLFIVPLVLPSIIIGILVAVFSLRERPVYQPTDRVGHSVCISCGYCLRGLSGDVCPECGIRQYNVLHITSRHERARVTWDPCERRRILTISIGTGSAGEGVLSSAQ